MKRNTFIRAFVMVTFLVFVVSTAKISGEELWQDVSSINQFVGKWEGYRNVRIPKNEENFMPESSIEVSLAIEYIRGSKDVFVNMKMDMDKFLSDCIKMNSTSGGGLLKDDLWDIFLKIFENMEGFSIGGKYFVNYDLTSKAEELLSDNDAIFQINKNGSKIKMVFYETVSFGIGDEGFNEIILTKKNF